MCFVEVSARHIFALDSLLDNLRFTYHRTQSRHLHVGMVDQAEVSSCIVHLDAGIVGVIAQIWKGRGLHSR